MKDGQTIHARIKTTLGYEDTFPMTSSFRIGKNGRIRSANPGGNSSIALKARSWSSRLCCHRPVRKLWNTMTT